MKPRPGESIEIEASMRDQPPRGDARESPERRLVVHPGSLVR
jgi:hypothetical protein